MMTVTDSSKTSSALSLHSLQKSHTHTVQTNTINLLQSFFERSHGGYSHLVFGVVLFTVRIHGDNSLFFMRLLKSLNHNRSQLTSPHGPCLCCQQLHTPQLSLAGIRCNEFFISSTSSSSGMLSSSSSAASMSVIWNPAFTKHFVIVKFFISTAHFTKCTASITDVHLETLSGLTEWSLS